MGETVLNIVLKLLNILLNLCIDALNFVFSALPDSPFSVIDVPNNIKEYLGYIAWLIPIGAIVKITLLWIPCVLAYFGISIILRWFKVIE